MVRLLSDRLRRFELLMLGLGALSASALLAVNAWDDIRELLEGNLAGIHSVVYGLKLLLMEAALLAPFVVLAHLSRALLRETTRQRYRWAGLAISLAASAGVVGLLMGDVIHVDLEEALDALIASVVPALVLLSGCALLYGGLIWLAQHGKLESLSGDERAIRVRRD